MGTFMFIKIKRKETKKKGKLWICLFIYFLYIFLSLEMVVITSCALAPYRVKKFPCCALIVTVSWKLVPLWDIHIPGLEIGQWLCLLYLFCLYTVGIEFLWVGVVANLGMTKWIWILNRPLLPHGTGNFDFFVNLGILTVMCRNVVDVLGRLFTMAL